MTLTPWAAVGAGYLAGLVFFGLNFSWFGETAGALLGPFGGLLDLGPAAIEATAFALAGGLTALGSARFGGVRVALVAAAAFTVGEFLRSGGVMGAPLYQIGAAFVDTPLAPLAAVGGVYAVTFGVALIGAALALLALTRDRRSAVLFTGTVTAVGMAALAAWWTWPARSIPPGTLRVAAVQGNIRQSVKWNPASLPVAVERYTAMTATLRSFSPQFVLWPETVISTDLALDPALAMVPANAALAAADRGLQARFTSLARSLDTVIAVGSIEATAGKSYNALFFFGPHGQVQPPYRKRQLVPFAEFLPGPAWLRNAPFADLVSDLGAGTDAGPYDARLRVAPLICWESGFGDLAQRQVARGAKFFAIATDDAWFGDSDGPYAQAQVAQLRAIETGRWVVRAAATGISGIIAPDGTWRERSTLDTQTIVTGTIGDPQPTIYSRLGPVPIGAALALLTLLAFVVPGRPAR